MSANRERIKEKTIELIQKDGIQETSIRDIASSCGISTGTLTYYFPSREDLLFELLVDHVYQRDLTLADILLLEDRDEKKRQLEEFFLEEANAFWQRLHFHLVGVALSGNAKLEEKLMESSQAWEKQLASLPIMQRFETEEKRMAEASLLNATLNGLSVSRALNYFPGRPQDVLAAFIERFELS